MDDIHIYLASDKSFMIPKKAMSADEYEVLKTEIGNKVRNGL